MFDVPFRYGGGWEPRPTGAGAGHRATAETNEKLFGGANSVGRTLRWNDREFRVVGVLAPWMPMPEVLRPR